MKKLKLYYLIGKEWILEKWYGSAFDVFLLGCIGLILLTILSIIFGGL